MKNLPLYNIESIAYRECIPGRHMQVSVAQDLNELPKFRRYAPGNCYIAPSSRMLSGRVGDSWGNTAFTEGWAIYAEYFPKEYGFYTDPYADFGRMADEAFNAACLVVDVGIHFMKWDKEKALEYILENTPLTGENAEKETERCIVLPVQATGYKIGMMKIVQLRQRAEKALGSKFNIKEFHDVVLGGGSLPLNLLEDNVNYWINDKIEKK